MSVQTRHLRPVPDSTEQRGGDILDALRDLNLKTKANAKREILAELAQHYIEKPGEVLLSWEVAEQLLARAEEFKGEAGV